MLPHWQSKLSFEALIDDLFENADPLEASPKANPVSIASLEAAWELAAGQREHSPAPEPQIKNILRDADGTDAGGNADAMLDPNRIFSELGLHAGLLETDIATLKREFALRNHPDRVPDELRHLATQRMMVANTLIDAYVGKMRKDREGSRGDQTR